MCGRYASTRSSADLAALFDAYDETDGEVTSDYNVAPTDPVPIVRIPSSARVEPVAGAPVGRRGCSRWPGGASYRPGRKTSRVPLA